MSITRKCKIDGCSGEGKLDFKTRKRYLTKGYCQNHYKYSMYGEPKYGSPATYGSRSEYRAWHNARSRCTNPMNRQYENYGGRGIKMCDEWLYSFELFIKHIGHKPNHKLTLDRINNDGNYEPCNVRWATMKQQIENRRPPKNYLEHDKKVRYLKLKSGIYYSDYSQAWVVKIRENGSQRTLKVTPNKEEAEKVLLDYAINL